MSKYNDLKCFFNLHDLEVYKEEKLLDIKDSPVGKVIICKCKNCGKIRHYRIRTSETMSRL